MGRRFCTAAVALATALAAAPAQAPVLVGIDALEFDNFARLHEAHVGLVTNDTGRNRLGERTIDVLRRAKDVHLVALFSPEHGLSAAGEGAIQDQQDNASGLRVYSLYGDQRQPSPEMLEGIDTLVFDVQDIGARFYTYVSTMGLCLRAAGQKAIRFMVLDRPNPLGGAVVAGPMLDPGREGFTGFFPMPVRHGMTMGELARMFNTELKIEAQLAVVDVRNWRRDQTYDQTGLWWVNPSPNIRSLTQALLYPGIGLLETTNLSVGRGTATPFELIGAPWLDAPRLVRALQTARLPGVAFVPRRFTPDSATFSGVECSGVQMLITDRATFDPIQLGFALACSLRDLHGEQWHMADIDRLLCNKATLEALSAGKAATDLPALWQEPLAAFAKLRSRYLIYK